MTQSALKSYCQRSARKLACRTWQSSISFGFAAQRLESILQIVNFVIRQSKPQTEVSVNQRLTPQSQQVNALVTGVG